MRFILNNKAPTMEVLKKEYFNGPGWCSLCKQVDETIDHPIMTHSFTKEAWKEVECMIGKGNVWEGLDAEEAFRAWYSRKDTKKIKALPLNIDWGVWLARNLILFERKNNLSLKCVI